MVSITFTISENTIEVVSMNAAYKSVSTYSYDNYTNKTSSVNVATSNSTGNYGIKDLVISIHGNTYTWSGNAYSFITVGNTLTYTGPVLDNFEISY